MLIAASSLPPDVGHFIETAHATLGPALWQYLRREMRTQRREAALLREASVRQFVCLRICMNLTKWVLTASACWPAALGQPGGMIGVMRRAEAGHRVPAWAAAMAIEQRLGWPPPTRPSLLGVPLADAFVWACGPAVVDRLVRLAAGFHQALAVKDPPYAEHLVRYRSADWFDDPAVRGILGRCGSAKALRVLEDEVQAGCLPSQVRRVEQTSTPGRFRIEPADAVRAFRGPGQPTDLNECFAILACLQARGASNQDHSGGRQPKFLADLTVELDHERSSRGRRTPATGMKVDSVKKTSKRVRRRAGWVPVPAALVGTRLHRLLDELDIYGVP